MAEITRFATTFLPVQHKFDAWRTTVGALLDVKADDTRRFDAEVECLMLDGLVLGRCKASAQQFNRSLARIAADGVDHYMIQLFLDGTSRIGPSRTAADARPGALVAFDLGAELASHNTDFELVMLFVPRRRLDGLLDHPGGIHGCVVDTEAGPGRLAAEYLRALFETSGALRAHEYAATADIVLRLVALAFNAAAYGADGPTPDWGNHAVLMRARDAMRQCLADPALSPQMIADLVCVSRPTLYRAFAETEGVMEELREMRLLRCRSALLSQQSRHEHVGQIGYRFGFSSSGSFSRSFKSRFGVAPSDMRRFGPPPASPENPEFSSGDSGPAIDATFAEWVMSLA